ncbi:PucR family transcriptional regulator [Cohnella faecalis]|uniref:PucR family transcriptional regulator n=1 Tax=Cohnella faecalis TaxID=2315694 RepID=A0A398CCY2_9BACL|nr:helix-turn-helix domain-containing protein [Cohnella faecalis]RIE01036.1 PucR family transcriptional regulator [Cohnella faecalis]
MNKARLDQLSELLGAPVATRTITNAEWEKDGGSKRLEVGSVCTLKQGARLVIRLEGSEIQVLETTAKLTPLERELLGWALKQGVKPGSAGSNLERQSKRLGEWIGQCISSGEWRTEVPDRMELYNRLFDGMIPFLLYCEQLEDKEPSYAELEKTIRSFIEDDTLLIPLREHEWLVLGSDRLLAEVETLDDDSAIDEEIKETLSSLASGLHQLVTGEWGGDCHVAVALPIVPSESVVYTVANLRETIYLGRKFHMGMQVHLPWLVHLEKLLNSIPEPVRAKFVEEMLGRSDMFTDVETVATLDVFFSMDCNVSETAKKLFIHRNTLLYRLDKLKQESGLDVRSFNDAVMMRILLLLYKVTKRK